MTQPVARVEVVREEHFGTTIDDPYRWMEDVRGEEMRAWLEAQDAHTRAVLAALPDRDALLGRIRALGAAGPLLTRFQRVDGRTFYLRRDPGDNLGKLVVRVTPDAPERVLLDPNTMPGDVHTAVDWYSPSPDGGLVAYGISQGGSEESVLHLLNVDTGADLGLAITRTRFGSVDWLPDGSGFVYHRLAAYPPGTPPTQRYANSRSYLHRLGADPEQDPPVLGRDLHPGVDVAPTSFPIVLLSPVSAWIRGVLIHGVRNEMTVYVAPVAALADPATIPWRKVADVDDAVTGTDIRGDTLYLLTHRDAPRYRVVATPAGAPDVAHARVVVPESTVVIEDLRVAGDYLLTRDLDAGIGRVRRVPLAGGDPEAVRLPVAGAITGWAGDPATAEVLLVLTSWTASPRVYRLDADTAALQDTGWWPPSPVDFGDVEAREVFAPGQDGTPIPLSIIHRKGLTLSGRNPTLLMGYGSYGISIPPEFVPTMHAWYERGGIWAIAHIRGGGEHGEDWHEAGRKLNKQTTVDDFIACGEYLVREGYTSSAFLAGEGTSAGGIPSGNALVQRPDLWAVMVIRVGATNMLRSEFSENGPPNVPEFGSITTEDGLRGLRIMDSYTKVRDGAAYPAVLLTTGLNDPRVELVAGGQDDRAAAGGDGLRPPDLAARRAAGRAWHGLDAIPA